MKRVLNKTALLFILLDNLYLPLNLGFDFRIQYLLYAFFIFLYAFIHSTVKVNLKTTLYLLTLFLMLSIIPIYKGFGINGYLKQLILILFNLLFSYLLIRSYHFNVKRIFLDYIDLIFVAAIVGLVQITSQFIGFRYGADFSYLGFDMFTFTMENRKIQSWFQEPSFLSLAFIPVVFVAISRIFGLTKMISISKSLTIISVIILSQSSLGLIGLLLCFIIIVSEKYSFFRKPHLVTIFLFFFILLSFSFYQIPQVKLRVDDSLALFFDKEVTRKDIDNTNLSTYALFSNFRVSVASFRDNPFFGSGLGTYESTYDRYITEVIPKSEFRKRYPLNKKDANSLFLRICTEFGLFGLILLAYFLLRNRIKFKPRENVDLWIINNAVLVLILARLLRQGHYTMLGFGVFILIYYYSKKEDSLLVSSANESRKDLNQ